jgi:hypothetical protein
VHQGQEVLAARRVQQLPAAQRVQQLPPEWAARQEQVRRLLASRREHHVPRVPTARSVGLAPTERAQTERPQTERVPTERVPMARGPMARAQTVRAQTVRPARARVEVWGPAQAQASR